MAMNPFGLSREQIAKMGPVKSIPQGKDPAQERAEIEKRINELRDIAEFQNVPKLVEWLRGRHATSMARLLYAQGDDQRREAQAEAKVFASIYRDIVTASEQVGKLQDRLESRKAARVWKNGNTLDNVTKIPHIG